MCRCDTLKIFNVDIYCEWMLCDGMRWTGDAELLMNGAGKQGFLFLVYFICIFFKKITTFFVSKTLSKFIAKSYYILECKHVFFLFISFVIFLKINYYSFCSKIQAFVQIRNKKLLYFGLEVVLYSLCLSKLNP